MNKLKLLLGRRSLITVLSLGFMGLGIGCITWAIFSLWVPYFYSADATSIHVSNPTTFVSEQNKLTGDSIATMKSGNSSDDLNLDKIIYPVYPAEGENIGSLTIPALNRKLSIFQGTDVKELNKGVGHFNQSVLPGEEDNCVLSGHRDTVFSQIGNLKIGDKLIVITSAGTFTYEVNGTRIVHKDDNTVIVPTDHAVLTMTTCYPFNFLGDAPDRYIVSSSLVKDK